MLQPILDENSPQPYFRPLWAIAALITSAAFVTSVLAQGLVLVFEQRTGARVSSRSMDTPLSLARGALIVQLALATLIVVVLGRYRMLRQRMSVRARLPWVSWVNCLGLVLGLAPVANDIGIRVAQALHQPPENSTWVSLLVLSASTREFAMLAFVLIVMPALVEELLFRGVLMGALLGARAWLVVGLQALAFGVFHVDVAQGLATFVLGLGFGFMRLRTRTLAVSMLSHAMYNAIVLASMRFTPITSNSSTHQNFGVVFAGTLLSAVCVMGLLRHQGEPSPQPRAT